MNFIKYFLNGENFHVSFLKSIKVQVETNYISMTNAPDSVLLFAMSK